MRQTRRALCVLGGLVIGAATALAAVPAHAAASKGISASTLSPTHGNAHWKLVFKDDFNHALNTTRDWDVYKTGGSSNPETEWFAPSHVKVSGGQLHINGYVDKAVKSDGRIVTGGLGLWQRPMKYGKYEALVRMQACAQVKYAWMLWPYSNNWPTDGEIDFAEDEGGNRSTTTASLNYAGPSGQRLTVKQDRAKPAGGFADWHVLGVEWTPKSVRYTMDGHYWGAIKTTHIPQTPMVFVMQTEGMAHPGSVNLPGGSCNADVGWVAQWKYTP